MVVSKLVDGLSPGQVLGTNNEGKIFEDGFRGHNSRGEASVPATPVLSATEAGFDDAMNAAPLSAVNVPHVGSNWGSRVVMEGHGVKANKHTIPKCAPAFPDDKGYEKAKLSETDGESTSQQKPIGFRPDLAESIVASQPIGFRPDLSKSLQASPSLGFRPDLLVSKSSSMGYGHMEPGVCKDGVGCPIHVEPRESTCGETFDKEREGCDLQGYMVRGQWPTWDLSSGTLGGSKPMSYPDRPPEVGKFVMPPSEAVSQGEGGGIGSVGVGVGCASGESTPLRTLPVTLSRIPCSDQPNKAVQPGKEEIRDSLVVSGHNRRCKAEAPDQARPNLYGVNLQEDSGQSILCGKDMVGVHEAGSAISTQHMDPSGYAPLNCRSLQVGHVGSMGDGPHRTSLEFSPSNSPALGTDVILSSCTPGPMPLRSSLEIFQTKHVSKCALPEVKPADWCMQQQGNVGAWNKAFESGKGNVRAWNKAFGSSFPPILSKVQGSLPANLLRPNIALPAWAQRMKHGGLAASGPVPASIFSGKMSPASPASIKVSTPRYPPHGYKVDGSGKSPGLGAFPATNASVPICSQVEESSCSNTRDPDSASLDLDILQQQGSLCGNANAESSHKPLGFSPHIPQVTGSQGNNANVDPHYEPLGFSPDLLQVQGSLCRAVHLDSSCKLLGCCQDSRLAQSSLNSNVHSGPEQYQIHSDDDDCSPTSDATDYFGWEQSWVDLNEPPHHWSSASAGPGILRVPAHEPGAQERRCSTSRVTWHVPLEVSSGWPPEYKAAKLNLLVGPFCVGRLIASQTPGNSVGSWPTLACAFMCRLLTLQVSQAQRTGRHFEQPPGSRIIYGTTRWRQLPHGCIQSVVSAPSRPQSASLLSDTLPGCTSVSGDDCGNALVQACLSARWGETSSPDTNFEISLCVKPGQVSGREIRSEESEDLNPKSLRFSSSLTRAMPSQSDEAGQGELCQHLPHKPLKLSSVFRGSHGAVEGVAKDQAGSTRLMQGLPGAHEDQADAAGRMPGSAVAYRDPADSACSMPGPIGANFKISAPQDEVGRVCFLQGSTGAQGDQAGQCATVQLPQANCPHPGTQAQGASPCSTLGAMHQVSSAVLGAMPQVSGATLGAMHQVSSAVLGAMPQVSGATLGAMPQVSGAVLGAMSQVSGATSGAMPQVSGAVLGAMPQVSGATLGAMLQASDAVSGVRWQVQSADSREPLDPSPIRFRSLTRAEQGAIEQSTHVGEQLQGTGTCTSSGLVSVRLRSPSQERQRESPGDCSTTQVDDVSAHKGQVGSARFSRGSEVASGSSGTPDPSQDITGLRVSVMHLDARVQVDCVRGRASRAPVTRIKYSMKYDQFRSHLNPTPLGFSPEPTTSKVSQVVRFSPEIGRQVSPALSLGMNGQEMRDNLRAQRGRDGVHMDPQCETDQEPTGRMFGLVDFLGLKKVQKILCGLLGPDLMTWLSVGKASIVTLYRSSRALGACSKEMEQAIKGKETSSTSPEADSGPVRPVQRCQSVEGQHYKGSSLSTHASSTQGASQWLGPMNQAGHDVVHSTPLVDQGLTWFLLLGPGRLGSFSNQAELARLVSCGGVAGALAKVMMVGQWVLPQRTELAPPQCVKVDPACSRMVCPHHAKGFCRYGSMCKFLHQSPTLGELQVTAVDTPSPPVTEVTCKHFIKGWCRRGHACRLRHGDPPDGSSVPTAVEQKGVDEARKVCPHFLKGNCLRGRGCGYIHTKQAVLSDDANALQMSEQSAQEAQVKCPHFDKGFCRRGQSCRFAHVSDRPAMKGAPPFLDGGRRIKHQTLAQAKKDQLREAGLLDVCFRWAQGRCEAAGCRFSHRPLRQWEIELLGRLLDGNDAQPEALQPDDQALASAEQDATSHGYPQQDTGREGHQWDVTVPLSQPTPLILEPSSQNKCKLSAPRPSSSLRKGVKVYMPGSTILRRKLGDYSSTRIVPLPSQQSSRSVLNQPYALASPPGQPEKTWCHLRVSRSHISGSLQKEITPGKGSRFPLASYILNPQGTRVKSAVPHPENVSGTIRGELIKQSVFRRAWADMSDSPEEEEADQHKFQVSRQAESGQNISLSLDASKPSGVTGQQQRRLKRYAFWKLRRMHRPVRHKETDSDPRSSLASVSVSQPQDSQRQAKVSRVILDSVWTHVAERQWSSQTSLSLAKPSLQASANSKGISSVVPLPHLKVKADSLRGRSINARGRSPTSRSLRGSSKPVSRAKHALPLTLAASEVSPQPLQISRSARSPLSECRNPEKCDHLQPGELPQNQRAFSTNRDWVSSSVTTCHFETTPAKLPRCRSLTLESLRFKPEPVRGPGSVELQDSLSLGSGFQACQQTGEYPIQRMVPPGTVCLETCSCLGNAAVDRPETETFSRDFHPPRARSLGSRLPLVLNFASSGGARRSDCSLKLRPRSDPRRVTSPLLLPGISHRTPARSKPYPAGAGGGVPDVRCFSQGVGLPKHELRNVSKGFNATLGFPGEGPSVPQPRTPPQGVRQPKTPPKPPPKAIDPNPVPPWNLELEAEVRGVVDSYLQRGKANSTVIVTESRRILGPPPKSSKAARSTLHGSVRQPPEPPAPRARAKVPNAGDSRVKVVGPKAGVASLTPPPPPKAKRVQPEQSRVVKPKFDTGFCYPAPAGMTPGTLSFSGVRVSLQENPDLPGIRPSMPLNLDCRLPYEGARKGNRTAEGASEPPVVGKSTSTPKATFARPTPKVRRQKDTPLESVGNPPPGQERSEVLSRGDLLSMPSSGPAGEPVLVSSAKAGSVEGRGGRDDRPEFSTVQGSALDTGELSSSSSELEVRSSRDVTDKGLLTREVYVEKGSPEPANPKVSPPSVNSPEPANPKVSPPSVDSPALAGSEVSQPVVGGPEPTSPNPMRLEPTSAQASRITTLFNVADSRQPDSLKGAQSPIVGFELDNGRRPQTLESRPGPSTPEDLCPPGSSAEPFGHEETRAVVTIPESASIRVPEQTGSEPSKGGGSGGELLETSTVGVQPYQVSVKLEADLERGAEWRRLSLPEPAGMTLRAHQTRRVLEALLLCWKPGSCLGHLTRVMSENLVSVDSRSAVTLRDRMGQMVVGSTIIASFVPDPNGPEVVVNSPVIQRLMACSQLTANACSRCDPTAPSVWLRSVSRPRDAFVMDMQMRLRVVPAGTLCRDILRALDRQDHPLVVLCRSLEHWFPLPAQYKVGPGWVVLQWPVPYPAAA